ncbi:MAG: hypothetical protein EOO10_15580 [Chitinophagaceae bacterium]|nr:MAG: hypothetical protein EOO10_15580 [Chitinophagaceae bacterium]
MLKPVLGATAFFALCADTPYRVLPYDRYTVHEVKYTEELCWRGSEEQVLQDLRNKGLTVAKESERYYPLTSNYSELYYQVKRGDSAAWQPIPYSADLIIYVKQKQYDPNYVIAEYNFEGQIFKNIRFRITTDSDNKKIICVKMISFDSGITKYETYPDRKTRKSFKPYFENLFGIKRK